MKKPPHPPDELIGWSIKEIARIARVDLTTARRWKRGAVPLRPGILPALERDLGYFDPAWSGWILRKGKLISPEGWEATPGQILATRFHEAQLAAWRREVKSWQAYAQELETNGFREEQPLPEEFANSQLKMTRV